MSFFERAKDKWIVRVSVQPGARTTELVGIRNNAIRLNIKSPAQRGRANKECLQFLAGLVGVNAWQLKIIRGEKSRNKLIELNEAEQNTIRKKLERLEGKSDV